jgi:hypothetical protein
MLYLNKKYIQLLKSSINNVIIIEEKLIIVECVNT